MVLTSDKQDGPKGEVHKNIVKKSGQAQLTFSVEAHTKQQVGGSDMSWILSYRQQAGN